MARQKETRRNQRQKRLTHDKKNELPLAENATIRATIRATKTDAHAHA